MTLHVRLQIIHSLGILTRHVTYTTHMRHTCTLHNQVSTCSLCSLPRSHRCGLCMERGFLHTILASRSDLSPECFEAFACVFVSRLFRRVREFSFATLSGPPDSKYAKHNRIDLMVSMYLYVYMLICICSLYIFICSRGSCSYSVRHIRILTLILYLCVVIISSTYG